jgi:membrane protein YqaA with SNARE-associated domain
VKDEGTAGIEPSPPLRNPFKRLYRWILSWAHHPMGTWALAVFAFLDSSVFPIPPLFLQVALSLERPKRSWWYATVNTVASVLGACLGYLIGYVAWDLIGRHVVGDLEPEMKEKILNHQFAVTLIYSFVPLPYKLITIGSGLLHANLATLLIASTIGRSLRFYTLGALCRFYGPHASEFIDRHFNKVMIAIAAFVTAVVVVMAALR